MSPLGRRTLMIGMALSLALAMAPHAGVHAAETGHGGAAGGHGATPSGGAAPMLMLSTEPATVEAGKPARLNLMLHGPTGAMISKFDTVHEKKLHLIIVRDGLDRFAHIHPEVGRSGITATFTFPTPGRYLLYADFKPTGAGQSVAMAELSVAGEAPPKPPLVPDAPGRVAGDGLTADIAISGAVVGRTARIAFALTDASGTRVTDLQPYLGAMGHLVIVSADGTRYLHSHPLDRRPAGEVAFETDFPAAGLYKGWGQFQRAGRVLTVPFVAEVR